MMKIFLFIVFVVYFSKGEAHPFAEQSNTTANRNCSESEFKCANGRCIFLDWQCENEKDCSDGSDEWKEACAGRTCDSHLLKCSSGICIPKAWICDGQADCPDGDDEKNCTDVNECESPGTCSQICENYEGRFQCSCVEGYIKDPQNSTRCKAAEGRASLLLSNKRNIAKISLDNYKMELIVNGTKQASPLDFVFKTGVIFWSNLSENTPKIYKTSIDEGRNRTVVVEKGLSAVEGLACDWIYNHIYWVDSYKNTIELASFEGTMRLVLIKDYFQKLRGIALNPVEGWMYWTDWGMEPKIERAGMDGTHRQTIVSSEITWPNGLVLDLVLKKIYWVDGKMNSISSCNYDGSDRRTILKSQELLPHPFSITTFEDWIYWTDWDQKAVFKADKFTGKNISAVTAINVLHNPMTIHVHHPHRQPDGENHCQAMNRTCSHLCLPAPQINAQSPKVSCACPNGLLMMEDNHTCSEIYIFPRNVTVVTELTDEKSSNQTELGELNVGSSLLEGSNQTVANVQELNRNDTQGTK